MSLLSRYINLIVIVFSTIIVISILFSTYLLVQNYKDEERNKMEIWSLATSELLDVNGQISNLNLEVLKKNTSTPMIKMDYDGKIEINNIKNIGLSSGASAPESLIEEIRAEFSRRYNIKEIQNLETKEDIYFKLPKALEN